MNMKRWFLAGLAAILAAAGVLAVLIATAPQHPVAVIRVVDRAGQPIAGATVMPEGLRTKPGAYTGGWYSWRADVHGVTNAPVVTDAAGRARLPYPKYVFERIETGTLCLSVSHPDYVSSRPERTVDIGPPAGAPWQARWDDLVARLRHRVFVFHPDPIVLSNGATLRLATVPVALPAAAQLFAQVSGEPYGETNFWARPTTNVITTRRLAAGTHTARLIRSDADGAVWFSDVVPVVAVTGQTNSLALPLKRGINLSGRLDDSVPRPVQHGRVVANVTPRGAKLQDEPPPWHAWTPVQADGSFTIASLPPGDLEIVALCDGFVSTNGPGQFKMHYPQRHLLADNDLAITIGIEPTARLEVQVTDNQGAPLPGVLVSTWPNVRYGEWAATVLADDCYNTLDGLLQKPGAGYKWGQAPPDFQGTSDSRGLAVLPNLPVETSELAVQHPKFDLPIVGKPADGQRRQASFTLSAGKTNRISIQLEPRERSKIKHY